MARFYGPFSIDDLPCNPNSGTLFNPNGKSYDSKYAFGITINNLTFSAPMFNSSGYLTTDSNIIENWNISSAKRQGFKIYADTSNRLRFRYWF